VALSPQFLDELRARTSLAALIGKSVKLAKKGREQAGCCPFHSEKTASFYVNDEKAFYHCFGCGAHGDAIRWLTDRQGLSFIDAVKELAEAAGLEVPAPTPEQRARDTQVESDAGALGRAADWYAHRLIREPAALEQLAARGIDGAAIARFGLGFAPRLGGVAGCGVAPAVLTRLGLLVEGDDGFRDRFRARVMIPIHDARGRVVGFGGRDARPSTSLGTSGDVAKFINSAESETFDKGRLLYNLHRAAPAARAAHRLIIVEGYFDAIALDQAGIAEAVAPMGTALTEAQLERAWRVHHAPVLLLDGDGAGRKAALRAAERALPMVGPLGQTLSIAKLPEGEDPDSFVRAQGRDALEAVIAAAEPLSSFVFDRLLEAA
jgi:DNA primase